MIATIMWLRNHVKTVSNIILVSFVGFLLSTCLILSKKNKSLSESLEIANTNIEAYQDIVNESWQASNVLRLDMKKLSEQKDSILQELDKVRKERNIKAKNVTVAATQKQVVNVNNTKEVRGDIIQLIKDTVYTDSMYYNDLTKVYYNIGKDSVSIALDFKNTQYLYVYKQRQYKNKKNFLQRLFTLDWKKISVYKYDIVNTNPLIGTEDVRVVETTSK